MPSSEGGTLEVDKQCSGNEGFKVEVNFDLGDIMLHTVELGLRLGLGLGGRQALSWSQF